MRSQDYYTCQQIGATRFGFAAGIVCGLMVMIATLIAAHTDHGHELLTMMQDMWPGYEVSDMGSLIGFVYGFSKAFLAFFLIAWIYNVFGGCPTQACKIDTRPDTTNGTQNLNGK